MESKRIENDRNVAREKREDEGREKTREDGGWRMEEKASGGER